MSRNRIRGQFGNSDTKNVKEHKERRTFMAADRAQSSSTSCPVRMVTMPAVSSSPLLWDTVSCRQLSTILYRCLKTRRIRAEQSDGEEVSLSETTGMKRSSPSFDVLPLQFISLKSATRLLLTTYVPTDRRRRGRTLLICDCNTDLL